MAKPLATEYPPFYAGYVANAKGNTVEELIENHSQYFIDYFTAIDHEKAMYAYAENKWTVQQVLQHIIDAERIFVYRLLRFCREDKTELPGFDENAYASSSLASNVQFNLLKREFVLLRQSTDLLLLQLTSTQLSLCGKANNNSITVNALAHIIFGHVQHHINVLQERYGL